MMGSQRRFETSGKLLIHEKKIVQLILQIFCTSYAALYPDSHIVKMVTALAASQDSDMRGN